MTNRIFITALLGAGALLASGADICVGSYNIRVLTPNDRGVHNWDARKEYVARTVTDNGMDVVGFNEVKSERQQTELRNLLPGYSFSGWDGHENSDITNETAVDLIGWRSEKFTLLDEGYYFLCRTPEKWENSWDNSDLNNVRHTSWVKLRENATGEDFYFFCCHLDHQGQLARMLQAHMNHALIKRIAGTAPHILVGDQNSTTSRVNYLNIFNANFDDAFTVTNASERYGADPATAGQWNDDPTAGRRIDYIWSDGFDVLSYDHCTDMYDLGAMPSDHIAIKATVRMQTPV
ncbi:MAG: endonuclease/exonuclease/phosphatase family protein, partial [Muribaculaceae bacterium]|nr:endonuclease/exonuclease/phosphatase family protein [Muribaculaceae bacterium]